MAAKRKKWRVDLWTAGGVRQVRATGERNAFDIANKEVRQAQAGITRVTRVQVRVNELEFGRWDLFEEFKPEVSHALTGDQPGPGHHQNG